MDSHSQSPVNFRLEEATKVFDSVLIDEPLNFYAVYGKALTHCKNGNIGECLKLIDKAIAIKPEDTDTNVKEMRYHVERAILTRKSTVILHLPVPISFSEVSPKDKSNKCKICDKNFTKNFSLNRHMYLHTGEKPHKCSICARAFVQKSDMERHEATHSGTFSFDCKLCLKRFKTKKSLKCHSVTHSVDRPFKCSFCSKDFKIKKLWRFHEGLHKDIKPFYCDVCGKGFPAKSYIKSHMRTHIEEKPFICSHCNVGFKRNYDLNFHVLHQHQVIIKKNYFT